jgi:hypothetical protein
MKQKLWLILLALAVIGAVPLTAQQSFISQGLGVSNGYWKTRYLFTNEVDHFMDPNDHGKVEFGKYFAEIQAAALGATQFAGGGAFRFAGLYLGVFADVNMGDGDFGFVDNNALSLMLGTSSIGAFKTFFIRDGGDTLGLDWGININNLRPEFMMAYDFDGFFWVGAALGIDLKEELSADFQYEIHLGDNGGFFHEHYLSAYFRHLSAINDALSAGWGLGAELHLSAIEGDVGAYQFYPGAVLGFEYKMGEVFSINGSALLTIPVTYSGITVEGFNILPKLGAAFTPYQNFRIELNCNAPGFAPAHSLTGLQPSMIEFLATLKK